MSHYRTTPTVIVLIKLPYTTILLHAPKHSIRFSDGLESPRGNISCANGRTQIDRNNGTMLHLPLQGWTYILLVMEQLSSYLILSDAVQTALQQRHPVVALESTVIAHGLPYSATIEVAQA